MKRNHAKLPILLALGLAAVGFNVANGDTINVPLDYATIQAAINAAATDDEIIVAAGTYAESITLSKKLTIKGANAGVAAGANPGVRGAETVIDGGFIVSVSGATIDGVTIQNGLLSGSMRVGVAVSASDVTVTNTVIQNVGVAPVTAQSDGLSTQPGNNNLTLTNSTIQNNWRGIYLNPGSGHVISGNLITANNGVGVGIGSDGQSNLTLSGNTISNHTLEGWGASAVGTGVVASGNSFLNNGVSVAHYGGSAINASNNYWGSASGPGSTVSGNVVTLPYYTDASLTTLGAPVTNTTQNTFFATIQAAINAATAGDTITVSAGTYSEGPISLNKAVILQGPNAGLAGTALTRGPEARIENSSITVTAAATIDGFEIYQTNNAENGVLVQAAATVTNSVIRRDGITTGNTVRGISTSVGLAGYSIIGNLITGDASGGFFGGHKTWNSGIYLNGGSGSVSGNTFENCRTALNADDFNAGIAISGNTFRTCGTYLSFGGTTPTTGQHVIAGNEFFIDWADPVTNWLPSAMLNNSNVTATFRIDATGNTFGGVATGALSDARKFLVEARMFHRGRSGRNGVVDFVANQQVVMPGTTIASAIAAAAAGDSVLVGPGTFNESVTLNKSLKLLGAGCSQTIWRGTAITGRSLLIVRDNAAPAAVHVEISGFSFETENNQSIRGDWSTSYSEALTLSIHNNCFKHVNSRNPGTDFALYLDGANQTPRGAQGAIRVFDNQFDVVTGGLLFENCRAVDVLGNTLNVTYEGITFNSYGTAGPVGEQLVSGNVFTLVPGDWGFAMNNWHGSGTYTVLPSEVSENTITDTGFSYSILYGVAAAQAAPHDFRVYRNAILSGTLMVWGDFASQVEIDATANWWDHQTGPSHAGNPVGQGTPISNQVSFSPWYADAAMTILVTAANFSNQTIPAGTTVTVTDLYIGGGTYTVKGSLIVNGELTLEPGATLEVIDGDLTINGSTLSGTFTFFNSMGSVDFNSDIEITTGANGLILISDVHVAKDAVITVSGSLVIDGCVVDCKTPGGPYTIAVQSGASFTMARTLMIDGVLNLAAADSKVYDNQFENTTVTVAAGTSGARVYHNLNLSLVDNGTATVTTVDGWGNVAGFADTKNRLLLDLDVSAGARRPHQGFGGQRLHPAFRRAHRHAGRQRPPGQDRGGRSAAGLQYRLLHRHQPRAGRRLGRATGRQHPQQLRGHRQARRGHRPELRLQRPGRHRGRPDDRRRGPDRPGAGRRDGVLPPGQARRDSFGGDTRLTSGGGAATPFVHVSPFTANSGLITTDGSLPVINVASANATQVQANQPLPVDVLDPSPAVPPAYVFRNGGHPLVLTFTAQDAGLAGLEFDESGGAVSADLTLSAYNGTTVLNSWTVSAAVLPANDPLGVVTYTVTLAVPPTATNGLYTVTASVRDRSGNWSAATVLGDFQIATELLATVELEGFTGGPREVVFTATDAGGATLKSWTKSVAFTGTTGSVNLEDVPAATAGLSAKTAWNLRSKVTPVFTPEGVGTAALTGGDKLPGGDLNGDNQVNTLDYSILRFNWHTTDPVADITGDALTNLTDFNILKGNFYSAGDPQ
jgi:hypothetical protein